MAQRSWVRVGVAVTLAVLAGCEAKGGGGGTPPTDAASGTDVVSASDVASTTDVVTGSDVVDAAARPDVATMNDGGTPPTDGSVSDGGKGDDVPAPTDGSVRSDGGNDTDVPRADGGAADVPVIVGDPCAMDRVIDLNARGTRMGEATTFMGNNTGTPRAGMFPASVCGRPGNFQVFVYRPRAEAALRVTTDLAGTDMNFDTVAFALSACGPMGTVLGCNDDAGGMERGRASTFTSQSVPAGQPVYIVVAGYEPPTGMPWTSTGPFALQVTEVAPVPIGSACMTAAGSPPCAAGSSCRGATGMQRCVAHGAQGGTCRTTMPACDMGLACGGGVCLQSVAVGQPCDNGVTNACVAGSSCRGATGMRRCVADGAQGGICRTTMPACEAGLACSGGTCVMSVAVGQPCDTTNTVCATGSTCVLPPAVGDAGVGTMGTCRANGSLNGYCDTVNPRCAAGSACARIGAREYCLPTVADGMSCDATGRTNVCTAGAACVSGTCRRQYTESAIASPTFIDACAMGTRVMVSSRDDADAPAAINIGFPFRFYGRDVNRVWPSTNGVMTVFAAADMAAAPDGIAGTLPDLDNPAMIAAWWTDLVLRATPMSDLCTHTVGAAPNRQFVVQWQNAYRFGAMDTTLSVEAVLTETTNTVDILWQRLEATMMANANLVDGSRATIGIQSAMGASHMNRSVPVAAGRGVRFTPAP